MADAVNIKINADTRQAQKGLRGLGQEFGTLDKGMSGLASRASLVAGGVAAVGAAAAAATAALVANANQVSALGDEIAKTARVTGVSAKQFQAYAFAAERGGASQAQMAQGLKVLSRNLLEAQQGSKQMSDRFAAMGIEVTNADGSLRDVDSVLADVADRVQTLGVGTQTTGELMQVMGRSGAELVNVLIDGSDGLAAMSAEAERLGGIMSDDLLQASEEYQDSLTNLKTAWQGVKNELAEATIPVLNRLANTLADDVLPKVQKFVSIVTGPAFKQAALPFKAIGSDFDMSLGAEILAPELARGSSGGGGGGGGSRSSGSAGESVAARMITASTINVDPEALAFTAMYGGDKDAFDAATAWVREQYALDNAAFAANEEMKTEKAREEAEKRRELAAVTAEAQQYAANQAFGAVATFAEIAQRAVEDSYFGQTRAGKTAARVLFATAKAAALAQAAVNTALAITNALANIPAPANIAAAVGVGLAGAAEIGVIAATAIQGLADGGLAPDALKQAGLNNHTVIAMRNDEAVIDPQGTSEITKMLALQRRQMEMGVMGRGANDARPVVVEMDGRRLTSALSPHMTREIEDGRDFRRDVRYAGAL